MKIGKKVAATQKDDSALILLQDIDEAMDGANGKLIPYKTIDAFFRRHESIRRSTDREMRDAFRWIFLGDKKETEARRKIISKIMFLNLVGYYLFWADIQIASENKSPSGTIFGISFSNIDNDKVIIGLVCFLFYLCIVMSWDVFKAHFFQSGGHAYFMGDLMSERRDLNSSAHKIYMMLEDHILAGRPINRMHLKPSIISYSGQRSYWITFLESFVLYGLSLSATGFLIRWAVQRIDDQSIFMFDVLQYMPWALLILIVFTVIYALRRGFYLIRLRKEFRKRTR